MPDSKRKNRASCIFLPDLPVKNLRPEDIMALMQNRLKSYLRKVR